MQPLVAVPSVTEDDLRAFHSQKFGSLVEDPAAARNGVSAEDGDQLGYYADGTKRTLTDEEIAIFRHSEIHALLQAQRRAKAAQAEAEAELSEGEVEEGEEKEMNNTGIIESKIDPGTGPLVSEGEDDEDDEAEYQRFLENERMEFQAEAASKRRGSSRSAEAMNDRTISTRRRVREMDGVTSFDQPLDYGDDTPTDGPAQASPLSDATPYPSSDPQAGKVPGRKIWWPVIGEGNT